MIDHRPLQVVKVVDKVFAEQSRYQAQILTQREFLLSLSYGRGISKPREADDQVVPAELSRAFQGASAETW